MPLLARRAASATERTLVYFRTNMYIRSPMRLSSAPRIKAYRAAAGLGPSSGMVESRMGAVAWGPLAIAPFPIPAQQTGRADFRHPAFRLASPQGTRRQTDRTRLRHGE